MRTRERTFCVGLVLSIWALMPAAGQTTVNVTTTADENGGGPLCALREAITTLNAGADFGGCVASGVGAPHVIELPAGLYQLTIAGTDENSNANGDLDVLVEMTITGSGADVTTIEGGGLESVLEILAGTESIVDVRDVTITGGGGDGGAGALVNESHLILRRCRVISNSTSQNGGGLRVTAGILLVHNSEIADNEAVGFGGGLTIGAASMVRVLNTTVSGNRAGRSGGGVSVGSASDLSLTHVTVANNTADADEDGDGDGGGINLSGAATTLIVSRSIIANNADLGGEANDCSGAVSSGDYNILEDDQGCTLSGGPQPSDLIGFDPNLRPLALNGGTSRTHALIAPSVAGDRIPTTSDCGVGVSSLDQIGTLRPQDGDDDGTAACDVGAFEAPQGELNPFFTDGFESGDASAWSLTVP